jgi:formylglycine-generating enzyme required for sulfatase activity
VTGNYFDYPTTTDTSPSNDLLSPDGGNNANFHVAPADWTVDSPYYRTEAGEFESSDSPYGTFDQGGNVWEWTEAVAFAESDRVIRGGAFQYSLDKLHAGSRMYGDPAYGEEGVHSNLSGIRVAQVPEPAMVGMLAIVAAALLRRPKRR